MGSGIGSSKAEDGAGHSDVLPLKCVDVVQHVDGLEALRLHPHCARRTRGMATASAASARRCFDLENARQAPRGARKAHRIPDRQARREEGAPRGLDVDVAKELVPEAGSAQKTASSQLHGMGCHRVGHVGGRQQYRA